MSTLLPPIRREVEFINRLLKAVHQQSLNKFHKGVGPWATTRMQNLLVLFQPFSSNEWLEKRLPSAQRPTGRLLTANHLIFLDFIEKEGALPILDMRWDLGHPVSEIQLRFRFFLLHWKDTEEKPRVVGFRLDAKDKSDCHDRLVLPPG